LSLCWLFGYSDYALELIDNQILGSLLEKNEKEALGKEETWVKPVLKKDSASRLTQFLGCLSHFLPTPARRNFYTHLPKMAEKPNILKKALGKR